MDKGIVVFSHSALPRGPGNTAGGSQHKASTYSLIPSVSGQNPAKLIHAVATGGLASYSLGGGNQKEHEGSFWHFLALGLVAGDLGMSGV